MTNLDTSKDLPEILAVFPLTGTLLLPGTVLPLHIFELRYRNMVEDALGAAKVFGMIQPFVPRQDGRPMPGADKESPNLYRVGCAGYIEKWERSPDGRYMVQLRGINCFRTEEELPLHRGYRRVKANYGVFTNSQDQEGWRCDRSALNGALAEYGKAQGFQIEISQLEKIGDCDLINGLAVALPLHPAEKQALLEALSPGERETILLDLLKLGGASDVSPSGTLSRTLN
jgi:Lon protease-like protein